MLDGAEVFMLDGAEVFMFVFAVIFPVFRRHYGINCFNIFSEIILKKQSYQHM